MEIYLLPVKNWLKTKTAHLITTKNENIESRFLRNVIALVDIVLKLFLQ